jgi:hypothetical protein
MIAILLSYLSLILFACSWEPCQMQIVQGGTQELPDLVVFVAFGDLKPDQNRGEQLRLFIENLKQVHAEFDPQQKVHCFISEQLRERDTEFNKGLLLNLAFRRLTDKYAPNRNLEALKIVMNDVDMLPNVELYKSYFGKYKAKLLLPWKNRTFVEAYGVEIPHGSAIPKYSHTITQGESQLIAQAPPFGGGISGFSYWVFQQNNGFPNTFQGWGGEDNTFYARTKNNKVQIEYDDEENSVRAFRSLDVARSRDGNVGKMSEVKHNDDTSNALMKKIILDKNCWKEDGYNRVAHIKIKVAQETDQTFRNLSFTRTQYNISDFSKICNFDCKKR